MLGSLRLGCLPRKTWSSLGIPSIGSGRLMRRPALARCCERSTRLTGTSGASGTTKKHSEVQLLRRFLGSRVEQEYRQRRVDLLAAERQLVALPSICRGPAVTYYRLYFMDPFNGHIARFVERECSTDAEALEWAQPHKGGMALELWNQHRKVARIEPQDVASKLIARRRLERRSAQSEHTEASVAA